MSEVTTTDKEVKVVVELHGVSKERIRINAYDNKVEINSEDPEKYHAVIDLPPEADIDIVKSAFTNGLLEITFDKKPKSKPKGKSKKVD